MSLLAPWFLVGLGTLAVPILVHLIQKERKEVVPFPSLMFIQQIPYQSTRRQQIRHWLLFLLRCLAILLLVLAFARPFFSSRAAAVTSSLTGGRDVVIALDRSYSMAYGDRWRHAVDAAKSAVNGLHAGDRAAVVYFAGTATVATPLTDDRVMLLAAIDNAKPGGGGTRYDAAFRLVQQVLGDSARPRREVVLVSDYQRAGWNARELPKLPDGTTLTQVNVGKEVTSNLAVTDVAMRYDTASGHERVAVEATLVNHGATPVQQRPVSFELNGRQMQTQRVDVPANGTAHVTFTPVPTPPGQSRGVLRAGPDALETDNTLYFTVTREPALPVLLLQSPEAGAAAGKFVSLALGIGDHPEYRIRPVRADQFSPDALQKTALVILNDAPFPGGDAGRRLVEYVQGGGGILVVLGSHSHPDGWPAFAAPLLPAPTGAAVDRRDDHGATLAFLDRGHPVFEAFNGPHSGDFSAAHVTRYWPLQLARGDQQLARFDDGRPALVERHVGAGRVLVWSSDLDGGWNDLPLQPVFLPLLHQLAQYTAGYTEARQWMTIGDVLSPPALFGESPRAPGSDAAPAAVGAQYVVLSPDGTQIRFNTTKRGAPASLELTEPGFYDMTRSNASGDSTRTVAVNVNPMESDLTPLDTALLAAAVSPRGTAAAQGHAVAELTPSETERRQEIWWYLLVTALLLLGAETLLSNRLSRALR